MISRVKAIGLLHECTGRDIWSAEYCRSRQIPEAWIAELADCFESGFKFDRDTIYHEQRVVNQYHGVRDIDLAQKLAACLGIDVELAMSRGFSPEAQVMALREAVDE